MSFYEKLSVTLLFISVVCFQGALWLILGAQIRTLHRNLRITQDRVGEINQAIANSEIFSDQSFLYNDLAKAIREIKAKLN